MARISQSLRPMLQVSHPSLTGLVRAGALRHAPFLMIVGIGVVAGILIFVKMKPVADHLAIPSEHSPYLHLLKTLQNPRYLIAFVNTAMLTTGAYMMMPFGTAFAVNRAGSAVPSKPIQRTWPTSSTTEYATAAV